MVDKRKVGQAPQEKNGEEGEIEGAEGVPEVENWEEEEEAEAEEDDWEQPPMDELVGLEPISDPKS